MANLPTSSPSAPAPASISHHVLSSSTSSSASSSAMAAASSASSTTASSFVVPSPSTTAVSSSGRSSASEASLSNSTARSESVRTQRSPDPRDKDNRHAHRPDCHNATGTDNGHGQPQSGRQGGDGGSASRSAIPARLAAVPDGHLSIIGAVASHSSHNSAAHSGSAQHHPPLSSRNMPGVARGVLELMGSDVDDADGNASAGSMPVPLLRFEADDAEVLPSQRPPRLSREALSAVPVSRGLGSPSGFISPPMLRDCDADSLASVDLHGGVDHQGGDFLAPLLDLAPVDSGGVFGQALSPLSPFGRSSAVSVASMERASFCRSLGLAPSPHHPSLRHSQHQHPGDRLLSGRTSRAPSSARRRLSKASHQSARSSPAPSGVLSGAISGTESPSCGPLPIGLPLPPPLHSITTRSSPQPFQNATPVSASVSQSGRTGRSPLASYRGDGQQSANGASARSTAGSRSDASQRPASATVALPPALAGCLQDSHIPSASGHVSARSEHTAQVPDNGTVQPSSTSRSTPRYDRGAELMEGETGAGCGPLSPDAVVRGDTAMKDVRSQPPRLPVSLTPLSLQPGRAMSSRRGSMSPGLSGAGLGLSMVSSRRSLPGALVPSTPTHPTTVPCGDITTAAESLADGVATPGRHLSLMSVPVTPSATQPVLATTCSTSSSALQSSQRLLSIVSSAVDDAVDGAVQLHTRDVVVSTGTCTVDTDAKTTTSTAACEPVHGDNNALAELSATRVPTDSKLEETAQSLAPDNSDGKNSDSSAKSPAVHPLKRGATLPPGVPAASPLRGATTRSLSFGAALVGEEHSMTRTALRSLPKAHLFGDDASSADGGTDLGSTAGGRSDAGGQASVKARTPERQPPPDLLTGRRAKSVDGNVGSTDSVSPSAPDARTHLEPSPRCGSPADPFTAATTTPSRMSMLSLLREKAASSPVVDTVRSDGSASAAKPHVCNSGSSLFDGDRRDSGEVYLGCDGKVLSTASSGNNAVHPMSTLVNGEGVSERGGDANAIAQPGKGEEDTEAESKKRLAQGRAERLRRRIAAVRLSTTTVQEQDMQRWATL